MKPILTILLIVLVSSCNREESHNQSDSIISEQNKQKEFYDYLENDTFVQTKIDFMKFESKIYDLNNDSLWIVNLIDTINNFMIVRGYQNVNGFKLVFDEEYDTFDYQSDTIIDIDFDDDFDYVINYYSSVGCCPRESKLVYFNNNGVCNSEAISFLNSFIDKSNRTIQMMEYGHSPFISLSKHEWEKDSLILIESIYYDLPNDASMIEDINWSQVNFNMIRENYKTGITDTIDIIPTEYQNIYNVDWFKTN